MPEYDEIHDRLTRARRRVVPPLDVIQPPPAPTREADSAVRLHELAAEWQLVCVRVAIDMLPPCLDADIESVTARALAAVDDWLGGDGPLAPHASWRQLAGSSAMRAVATGHVIDRLLTLGAVPGWYLILDDILAHVPRTDQWWSRCRHRLCLADIATARLDLDPVGPDEPFDAPPDDGTVEGLLARFAALRLDEPFEHVDDPDEFVAELRRECRRGHPLQRVPVQSIARRVDCDYVLFLVESDPPRLAGVHLTWATERDPEFPVTVFYASIEQWLADDYLPELITREWHPPLVEGG